MLVRIGNDLGTQLLILQCYRCHKILLGFIADYINFSLYVALLNVLITVTSVVVLVPKALQGIGGTQPNIE